MPPTSRAGRSVPDDISSRQFKTLWFDDDLDGDLLVADKPKSTDKPAPYRLKGANDLYGPDRDASNPEDGVRTTGNVNQIWQSIVDDDNDPTTRSTSARLTWTGALDEER